MAPDPAQHDYGTGEPYDAEFALGGHGQKRNGPLWKRTTASKTANGA